MSIIKKIHTGKKRRQARVRFRIKRESGLPRVSVFRSLKQIYAQIIDDNNHKTLVSASSLEFAKDKKLKGDKKAIAQAVGLELAKRATKEGVDRVVFDRGSYLFHGRVKALAEGLKQGGLNI